MVGWLVGWLGDFLQLFSISSNYYSMICLFNCKSNILRCTTTNSSAIRCNLSLQRIITPHLSLKVLMHPTGTQSAEKLRSNQIKYIQQKRNITVTNEVAFKSSPCQYHHLTIGRWQRYITARRQKVSLVLKCFSLGETPTWSAYVSWNHCPITH